MKVIHHASTVYLPTGHIGMFPDKLVKERLSSDANKRDGSALSFAFKVQNSGCDGEVPGALYPSTCKVVMVTIKAPFRLTYEQINRIGGK